MGRISKRVCPLFQIKGFVVHPVLDWIWRSLLSSLPWNFLRGASPSRVLDLGAGLFSPGFSPVSFCLGLTGVKARQREPRHLQHLQPDSPLPGEVWHNGSSS